jgi:hypothetical protein
VYFKSKNTTLAFLRKKNWSIVKTLGKDPAKMKT